MKNKLKAGIMISLTIAGLTACGNVEEKETVSGITEEIEITSLEQTSEAFETEDIKEEETDNTEMTMTEEEAWEIYHLLETKMPVNYVDRNSSNFRKGLTVTTFYLAKGLEFDQVFTIYGKQKENALIRQAKYICATRALHELYMYQLQ